MTDRELTDALAECLEALRQGDAELRACLARHESHRAELEALLEVVRRIPRLPATLRPSPTFRERTRRRLLSTGHDDPPTAPSWQNAGPA